METGQTRFTRLYIAIAIAIGAVFLASGCTHETAIVKETSNPPTAKMTQLEGIPFFPKKAVCNRETVWLEPQYTLTFTVEADGAPPLTHTLIVSRSGYEAPDTKSLLQVLSGMNKEYKLTEIYPYHCPARLGKQWDQLSGEINNNKDYQAQTGLDEDASKMQRAEQAEHRNVFLVANKADPGTAPDYSRQGYLNALSPWNGTSQISAKIAADGTLSEASAQRDTETLNTIVTGLAALVGDFTGASAAGTAVAGATATQQRKALLEQEKKQYRESAPQNCAEEAGWPKVSEGVKYVFKITTSIYQHDHRKQVDRIEQNAVKDRCDEPAAVYDGNFTVTREDPSKKSDKAIEFSGQVTLPEPKKKDASDKGS